MAKYIGPKDKLSRREGFDLFNKGIKLRKLNVKPGQLGQKTNKKLSEYGRQLRAKQKAKRFYGVLEKQFRNYVVEAGKSKEKSGEALISLLERRLDNVIFRLGFAPTRPAARQLVSHRHIFINGQIMNVPSYRVNVNDVISLSDKAKEIPSIKELLESEDKPLVPEWLEKNNNNGKMTREPQLTDVREPISVIDIIEFYSR
jgi:small subunit ribosomal protein S4